MQRFSIYRVRAETTVTQIARLLKACAILLTVNAYAEDARLQVSIEGGAFNSKFKFFDAGDGCPSYNDIPGAKHYLGGVRASDSGSTKKLALNQPVHIFLFRPRDMPGITAGGGEDEIRRRALQVVLSGDATLRYTSVEEKLPQWESSGYIEVRRAVVCERDPSSNDVSESEGEADSEVEDGEALES